MLHLLGPAHTKEALSGFDSMAMRARGKSGVASYRKLVCCLGVFLLSLIDAKRLYHNAPGYSI